MPVAIGMLAAPALAADSAAGTVFGGAQMREVYRIRLGGHLENGCKALYRLKVTIVRFSGTPLARKLNQEGTPVLQERSTS